MKVSTVLATLLASLVSAPPALAGPQQISEATREMSSQQLDGTWTGVLQAGPFVKLHLVLHLDRNSDGSWAGTLDSPDQGRLGIPLDHVDYRDGLLVATSNRLHGGFSGRYVAAEDRLEGTWAQGPFKTSLTLRRGPLPVVRRPQEPLPPYPYRVEDVHYPAGNVTLAGTLTLPEGQGPFPAVLLIPGSGLHDRDCTLFGHKPFKLWADTLTRRGIAVLRVDDRGTGASSGDPTKITSATNAADARAGVAYLRSLPEIDPRRVGLLGHSEGGLIADMVAAADPEIAFIVLLAAPALPGDQIIEQQVGMLARASGRTPEEVQEAVAKQAQILAIVKGPDDESEARRRLMAVLIGPNLTATEREQAEAAIDALLSPWYRYFVRTDPRTYLARVRCPVLAIDGQLDLQVASQPNLTEIQAILEKNGNHAVTVLSLPHLNHLLQTARTGLPDEYGEIQETLAPEALASVGAWIVTHDDPAR